MGAAGHINWLAVNHLFRAVYRMDTIFETVVAD
jgi:hypothetical protein